MSTGKALHQMQHKLAMMGIGWVQDFVCTPPDQASSSRGRYGLLGQCTYSKVQYS